MLLPLLPFSGSFPVPWACSLPAWARSFAILMRKEWLASLGHKDIYLHRTCRLEGNPLIKKTWEVGGDIWDEWTQLVYRYLYEYAWIQRTGESTESVIRAVKI